MSRRAILDPRRLVLSLFLLKFAIHHLKYSFFLLSSFHGIFLTEVWFSREGRWLSLNSGCQDVTVPPQIRVWGSFCFCCYFFCYIVPLSIIGAFSGRICSVVDTSVLSLQSRTNTCLCTMSTHRLRSVHVSHRTRLGLIVNSEIVLSTRYGKSMMFNNKTLENDNDFRSRCE